MTGEKEFGKFPEGILEYIAKIIGEYRTGSEITELFNVAGYPYIQHDGSTKWRFVYDVFKEFNSEPNGARHIEKIIQTFCDPTQWIDEEETFKRVLDRMNKALRHVNRQLNKKGEIIVIDAEIEFLSSAKEKREMPAEDKALKVFPIFNARDITQEEDLCFVLMPFKPSFDRIYKEQIKPTVESLKFRCIRADDIFTPTSILEDIWTHILKSRVIIADITGRNPNVFYEIGIAHTVGRPVIIITQDKKDVPFDISQFRYFVYSDEESGWKELRRNITLALKNIEKKKG